MSARNDEQAAACLASGFEELQRGNAGKAASFGRQALEIVPGHPDALHLLGIVAMQQAQFARALELLGQAAALRPEEPAFHCNLGYAYAGADRLPEALAAFERAMALDSADPEIHLNAGVCLTRMGRLQEAEAAFRRAADRAPRYAVAWFNLGNALKDQEKNDEACVAYQQALGLMPKHAETHHNLGITLYRLGRFEDAERAYSACLRLEPHNPAAMVDLAVTLNCLRRQAEAEALCRAALARDRGYGPGWAILGRSLAFQYRWTEAIDCYREAVKLFPANSDALCNLADALARAGRYEEAFDVFARTNDPAVAPRVRFSKAIALFTMGSVTAGAAEYFGRGKRTAFVEQHPELPLIERLTPQTRAEVFGLVGEQGIGDELFFLRYAPALQDRGFRLRYCGHSALGGMLLRCGVFDEVSSRLTSLLDADRRALVGDLPHLLADPAGSTSPLPADRFVDRARVPSFSRHYRVFWPELPGPLALTALPERIAAAAARLQAAGPRPYVAVTWRAGIPPQEQRGSLMSLSKEVPLEMLGAALRGVEATLVSLQRRPLQSETGQLSAVAGRTVHDFSSFNDDLEDMLALLTLIDDYVGVSNTNMHLRAGVGRGARVLVPWSPEWRWLFSGEESPWFPGFRVFRQAPNGSWDAALRQLKKELVFR